MEKRVSITTERGDGLTRLLARGNERGRKVFTQSGPYPEKETLPDLTVGKWHAEGFVAAVLTASDLLSSGQIEMQAERVHQFFQNSTQIAFDALRSSPS